MKYATGKELERIFKDEHQKLPSNRYALDLDLVFLEKKNGREFPIAILECKEITPEGQCLPPKWSQIVFFNWVKEKNLEVFIVGIDQTHSVYRLYEYLGGNPKPNPPQFDLKFLRCFSLSIEGLSRLDNFIRKKGRE